MKSDFLDDLVQNTTVPCRLAFKRLVNVQIGRVLETCVDKSFSIFMIFEHVSIKND